MVLALSQLILVGLNLLLVVLLRHLEGLSEPFQLLDELVSFGSGFK